MSINPDVIVAPAASLGPVREATHSIPIIFLLIIDPVGQGFVSSLAHPGGNLTGFTYAEFSIGGKLPRRRGDRMTAHGTEETCTRRGPMSACCS